VVLVVVGGGGLVVGGLVVGGVVVGGLVVGGLVVGALVVCDFGPPCGWGRVLFLAVVCVFLVAVAAGDITRTAVTAQTLTPSADRFGRRALNRRSEVITLRARPEARGAR
jgi:hypothetical protein